MRIAAATASVVYVPNVDAVAAALEVLQKVCCTCDAVYCQAF